MQSWLSPYGGQLVTPDARSLMLSFPGCSQAGKHLIYFDGHGHANQQVEVDNGYLMGAHGIMGGFDCSVCLLSWPTHVSQAFYFFVGMNPDNFSLPVAAEYGFFYFETYSMDDKRSQLNYITVKRYSQMFFLLLIQNLIHLPSKMTSTLLSSTVLKQTVVELVTA